MRQPTDPPRARAELEPRPDAPASVRMLNGWVNQVEQNLHTPGGRVSWLFASTIAIAALQRAWAADGNPHFLLKGGALLQHRLPAAPRRATMDVDGLIRGDIDDFIIKLDYALTASWGAAVSAPR